MKNKILLHLFAIIFTCFESEKLLGQSSIHGNTQTLANQFSGWDNIGIANAFDIKTEQNQPIHLHTFTGGGGFGNIRQTILPGYTISGGLIGFGDMGTTAAPFAPQNLLHLHRAGNIVSLYQQFTNLNTGITATDGVLFGMRHDIPSSTDIAEIRHQEDAPFALWTGDNAAVNQRMYVTHDNMGSFAFTDLTRVGIIENGAGFGPGGVRPRSLLHLGTPDAMVNGGFRQWMDVGTFYHISTDLCYTGLKLEPWSTAL